MTNQKKNLRFCGREFSGEELTLIREVVHSCSGISRTELAHTVCELLEWKRENGGLKARECRDLLESKKILTLPEKKPIAPQKARKKTTRADKDRPACKLSGSVEAFTPVDVELVQDSQQRLLFRELINQYHYLGYAMPFGARLQYLAYVARPCREVVGCVQFSSPAWRMKARDQWIGWDDAKRERRLQHVVTNSRLLIIPSIRNLASTVLSCALRRLSGDWQRQYGLEPFLVETLVDRQRFYGGCYRAANWIELGETSGRGRMDRKNERRGAHVKTIFVYPLVKNAIHRLRDTRGVAQ